MKDLKGDVRGFAKSFVFAFRGMKYCVRNERNMRIHIVVFLSALYIAFFYSLSEMEWIAFLTVSGLVICCEMINTAIEAMVNLEASAYDNIARIAKDVAAGAVLLTAFLSVIIGGIIFIQPPRLCQLFLTISEFPLLVLPLVFILLLGFPFILGFKLGKK